MLLAATPTWFADNAGQVTAATMIVLVLLVIRLVHKVVMRTTLLGILAILALLIYLNRTPLEACARTCECTIADREINVPICEPDFRR